MNIKALNPNPVTRVGPQARVDGETRLRDSAGDRDADGRRAPPEPPARDRLGQEEFDEAIAILEALPGLGSSGLVVRVETSGERRVTLIVDPDGRTVRRLTEGQLWAATRDRDRPTGGILDKAT